MDNSPESIAQATKDWSQEVDANIASIDLGSPWQNGHSKSCNDELRDDLLIIEIFDSMWEVKTMLQDRCYSFNHCGPHSAPSHLTPVEFSNKWHKENSSLLSQIVDRWMGSGQVELNRLISPLGIKYERFRILLGH